jgi:hypothetical protein
MIEFPAVAFKLCEDKELLPEDKVTLQKLQSKSKGRCALQLSASVV